MKELLNFKVVLIIVCLLVICFVEGGVIYYKYSNEIECVCESSDLFVNDVQMDNEADTDDNSYVYVDIKGAVKKPGVYKMRSSDIVNDVIVKAGGFTSLAYKNNLNLSKKIVNEMVIYVSTKSEYKNMTTTFTCPSVVEKTIVIDKSGEKEETEKVVEEKDYVINNGVTDNIVVDSEIKNDAEIDIDKDITEGLDNLDTDNAERKLININKAGEEELMTLTGIGASKAKAIIDYRNKNGNFEKIEDIVNVSGISSTMYEKIKDYITV